MSRIRVRLKAYDISLLDKSARDIAESIKNKGGTVVGPIPLPTRKKKYTILTSPHVDKDAREQFEMRIHKRLIDIYEPNQEMINGLMELQLPASVEVEIKQ